MNDRQYNGSNPPREDQEQQPIKTPTLVEGVQGETPLIFSSAGSDHENPLLDDIKQRTVDRLADAKRRGLIPDYSRLKQEDGHTFIPLVPDPDFVPLAAPDFTPMRTHRCPDCEREYTVKYGSVVECGRCGGLCEPIPVKALVMGKERLELINDDQLDYQAVEDWRSAAEPIIDRMSRWLERNTPKPSLVRLDTEPADFGKRFTRRSLTRLSREVYRWMPHLGGWVYRGVRRG